jgi:hypothetical protein
MTIGSGIQIILVITPTSGEATILALIKGEIY